MDLVAPSPLPIKASVAAAVHLLSIELAAGCPVPTTPAQAIAQTGTGRSQAYAMLARLRQGVETLTRPAGRPAAQRPDADILLRLSWAVITFLSEHPGCWSLADKGRATYHDDFRRFVVSQFAPGGLAADISVEQAAHAMALPLGAVKDWLHAALSSEASAPKTEDAAAQPAFTTTQPQIATLLAEYPQWKGNLSGFCEYARTELGLPFGRGFITTVLSTAGLHTPKPHRPAQAPWSRGSMRLDFPGMQWFGDGKQITIVLRGQTFAFNLEAFVDGASHATVGALVTDAEDARSIVDTFHDALHTVEGQMPMAVTLDNRASNDAPVVEQAMAGCEKLHATPGRGQAKAPVEGAFGLFEQSLPSPLVIEGQDDHELARSIANEVARAFFRGRNGRPSRKLGGKTPADAYLNSRVTDEQIREAEKWLLELRRREELARRTRERRSDPVRRELLRTELERLGIEDPKGNIALSLCGYSMDAILTGIAIFEGKQTRGALPVNCQPDRYLGGIIRNTDERELLEFTGRKLLELRLGVRDKQLTPLQAQAAEIGAAARGPVDRVCTFLDRCLHADTTIAFRFWSSRAIEAMGDLPDSEVLPVCAHVRRLIASSFRVDIRRRERLLADLLAAAVPVAA